MIQIFLAQKLSNLCVTMSVLVNPSPTLTSINIMLVAVADEDNLHHRIQDCSYHKTIEQLSPQPHREDDFVRFTVTEV